MTSIAELRRLEAGAEKVSRYDPGLAGIREDHAAMFECPDGEYVRYDDYLAMRNALPELLKALEWQPIETAPKDTKILVGYRNSLGNWRTVTACYHTQLPWSEDAWREDDDESEFAPEGWYEESETHENILPLEHDPTAWRPLPLPPHGGVDVG